MRSRTSLESLDSSSHRRPAIDTPQKQPPPPPRRMMHLPTPPPSFSSEAGTDSPTLDRNSALWSSSAQMARSGELRLSPTPVRLPPPSSEQDPNRLLRLSMSPEPDFPRLPPPGSSRATPDRDGGRETKESSPAVRRTPSPDPFDGDRSRSNSPEATMRPPPLSPLTEENLNAKHHRRTSSNGARSVMSAYDMITSYIGNDGQHPSTKRRHSGFQPNAGLSKPITPSFIRDYHSGSVPPDRAQSVEQLQRSTREISPEVEHGLREDGSSSRIFGGSLVISNNFSDGTATSQSGDILRMSELSRQRQAMGWKYVPLPENRIRHDMSPSVSLTHEEKEESLSTVYYKEFSLQLDSFARNLKKPVVTFVLIMIVPLLLSLGTSIITGSRGTAGTSNTTFGGSIDFPTLMSIEASFERVVDSAAGGSELARSLKQSEMAVADLSTVVKYSDLNCRETLSSRLEQFAVDARDNVVGLLEFSAKVGGVLDELLSVNQYALRELNALQSQRLKGTTAGSFIHRLPLPWPLSSTVSVIFPSPATIAKARLAQTFDTAVEVLETNLRLLIAHGTIIQAGLMGLSQQNGPIRTEIVREFADIRRGEAEAMSSLWARISTHSAKRQNFKENERLLREINVYHDKARGYVEVTLLELGRMTSELDNLRRRVAQPLLAERKVSGSSSQEIGMQDQVSAIQGSVDALLKKRSDRDDRQRLWNRIILEGTMHQVGGGVVEGPRF